MPSPGFNLAVAKDRLDITGTASDVEIQLALDTVVTLVESYCDRGIAERSGYVEEHFHCPSGVLSSWLYPIAAVNSISDYDNSTPTYRPNLQNGLLYLERWSRQPPITTNVDGGYDLVGGGCPLDLEQALWAIFDRVWAAIDSGEISSGVIKTLRVEGVGSVTYDTYDGTGITGGGFIPYALTSILDLYRRYWQ